MTADSDIQAIRRERLQRVIDTQFEGVQARLVEKIEMNQGELSGILSGKKPIGEKKARSLEKKLGLPLWYLDGDPVGPISEVVGQAMQALPVDDQEMILDLLYVRLQSTSAIYDGPAAERYLHMIEGIRADMKRRRYPIE